MKLFIVLVCLISLSAAFESDDEAFRKFKANPLFPKGRIVGGIDTNIEDVPYQVALEKQGFQFCGGTIISDTFVLTAAHCIITTASQMKVRVGASKRQTGGKVVGVSTIYQNPRYSDDTLDYDVAVLKLAEKLTFSQSVKAARLPQNEAPVGSSLKISGWGHTRENGQPSTTLKYVQIPVIDRNRCQQSYTNAGYRVRITPRMVCAYTPSKDACQGDSGGPAVTSGTVYGIVSWGAGCARPNIPGVYTNVGNSEVRDYIRKCTNL